MMCVLRNRALWDFICHGQLSELAILMLNFMHDQTNPEEASDEYFVP
jgi:hypothetical protein